MTGFQTPEASPRGGPRAHSLPYRRLRRPTCHPRPRRNAGTAPGGRHGAPRGAAVKALDAQPQRAGGLLPARERPRATPRPLIRNGPQPPRRGLTATRAGGRAAARPPVMLEAFRCNSRGVPLPADSLHDVPPPAVCATPADASPPGDSPGEHGGPARSGPRWRAGMSLGNRPGSWNNNNSASESLKRSVRLRGPRRASGRPPQPGPAARRGAGWPLRRGRGPRGDNALSGPAAYPGA